MIRVDLKKNIDPNLLSGRATKLENAMAWQVFKDTRPFVPASGAPAGMINRSYVRGSYIVYPGPYARYLYYGKVMVNAKTGKGPKKIPGVGYRWPEKAVLRPTNRDLKINTSFHKDATSHWMDVSLARNGKRWDDIARRIYTNG